MKFCWEIGNKKKPSGVKGIEIRVLKLFFSKGEVSIALSHEIKRHLLLGRKAMINADKVLRSRDRFADKGPSSQSYGFSSSHVWMWELDHEEGWVPMNWYFWIVVLEKALESPLDCKEIKAVHPKGNKSWIFIGRTDAEAEAPILWPPDGKNRPIGKDPDAGKDERQEEKGTIEDEMVGWHHLLMEMSVSKLQEIEKNREVWRAADHGVAKSWTWLSNWTVTKLKYHEMTNEVCYLGRWW